MRSSSAISVKRIELARRCWYDQRGAIGIDEPLQVQEMNVPPGFNRRARFSLGGYLVLRLEGESGNRTVVLLTVLGPNGDRVSKPIRREINWEGSYWEGWINLSDEQIIPTGSGTYEVAVTIAGRDIAKLPVEVLFKTD